MDKKLRLSLIFQAAGNATAFLRGVKGESQKAGQALAATRQRINQLQAAARDVSSFRAMETRLEGTRGELAAARAEAIRLGAAMDAAEQPTRQLTRAFDLAKRKVQELETRQAGQARGLDDLRTKLRTAGVATEALGAHELRLARDLKAANAELAVQSRRMEEVTERQRRMSAARGRYDRTQQLAGTMQGAGASAVAGGVVTAAPLFAAAREAMSFEEGMADVRKVVDFETPQQFRQMERDILNLSTRVPMAKEGLTQIVAAAGQAGIARRELIGFAEDAAQMGIAFDTTAEDAGAKMATWRTAFRMTQGEVRSLADQINYLGNTGPADALQISNIVTRIGPLGEVAGLAAAEIAALGSTIAGMGVEEEIAATGIKNTMLALTKGEAATRAQKQAFAALGLEASAVARGMQRDAGATIVNVMERIGALSPERQSAILTRLFGSESVAAIAPLLTNLDLLRTNLGKVARETLYAGSMQKEFEARASTASNAVRLGIQGLQAMATEIGTAFLPQIKAGARFMGDLAGRIRAFAEAHPGAIKVVGILVAVLAAGLTVFGGLAMVVAAVLGPFALLQLSLAQTGLLFARLAPALKAARTAVLGFNLALLANPIVLIAAAIVAAVALVGYVIYRNWGTIGPWLGRLWRGISDTVGRAIGVVKNLFMTFHPLGIVIRNWGAITGFLRGVWTLAGEMVGLGLDVIKYLLVRFTPVGMIMRNWSGISAFFSRIWTAASGAVSAGLQAMQRAVGIGLAAVLALLMRFTPLGVIVRNWSGISGAIGDAIGRARAILTAGVDALRQVISSWSPLQAFQQAFADVFSWFRGLPGRFLQMGSDIVAGMTRGIRGGRAAVQAATRDAAGSAEGAARRRLDTHSPSRVFAAIGRDVMAGFTQGIGRGAGGPIDQMRAAAAAIAAAGVVASPGFAFAAEPPGLGSPAASDESRRAPPFGPAGAGEGRSFAPPALTPPLRMPAPAPAGSRPAASAPLKVEVHIHAAPGQSEERIAQMVRRELQEILGGSGAGRYRDDESSWGDD